MREIARLLSTVSFAFILALTAACVKQPAEESTKENTNAGNSNQSDYTTQKPAPGSILAQREEQKAKRNPSQPGKGTIKVDSAPQGAAVLLIVDEEGGAGEPQPRGTTPTIITDIPPGKYAIHLELPGYKSYQKSIEVKPDSMPTIFGKLAKQ